MTKSVIAKFKCDLVTPDSYNNDAQNVTFSAVYSSDTEQENYMWSQATPYGVLTMHISNPNLKDHFEAGKEYMITLVEAKN